MFFFKKNREIGRAAVLIMLGLALALFSFQSAQAVQGDVYAPMSGQDKTLVIEGLRAIKRDDWRRAEQQFAQARDPLAAKLYYWFVYTKKDDDIDFFRIRRFIAQNPDWPLRGTLELHAEQAIDAKTPTDEVIKWFDKHPPRTSDGMDFYLKALMKTSQRRKMTDIARDWWATTLLSTELQREFYNSYGGLLDQDTHIKRWNRLLFANHYTNARRIVGLLPRGYAELTESRIALSEQSSNVNALIDKVPKDLRRDPGLMYERLRWRRRADLNLRAIEMFHTAPPIETIPNPQEWWHERHIITRRLLESKQYDSAYELVSRHMQEDGFAFAQAEFLAGWLALEYVDKPTKAFEHFEALYYRTSMPISRARGAYWTGKASLALGQKEIADQWFKIAAQHQTTFYGQLALERLKFAQNITNAPPPQILPEAKAYFEREEMVQVARLLHKAGMWDETDDFLQALARKTDDPEKYILVAEFSDELGHKHNALGIAKKGLNKNIFLMDHAYPTLLSFMHNVEIEWALVHAIVRQESAFNVRAQSHAGASGLMQLMPATAREVARKAGVRHNTSWLKSRPDHNIYLGARYLKQMLDRYDGSYVLAIAAYNGGPGRVDGWLKEIGDPRKAEIDYVNWIEKIPIYETRNYVQRVLEGTYVYRMKLENIQKYGNSRIHVAEN